MGTVSEEEYHDVEKTGHPKDVEFMSRKIRLVPRTTVSRADIEQLADSLSWTHYRTTTEDAQRPHETTWLAPDHGAAIHWIEDHVIRVNYLLIQGPDVAPTTDALKSRLDFYTSESLQATFDETRDGSALMDALHTLGVHCSGPFDPDLFALFRWAMNDPDPLIRRVALLAASMTHWREFIPLLDYVRAHDREESVRLQAQTIFDVMSTRTETASDSEHGAEREGEQ